MFRPGFAQQTGMGEEDNQRGKTRCGDRGETICMSGLGVATQREGVTGGWKPERQVGDR